MERRSLRAVFSDALAIPDACRQMRRASKGVRSSVRVDTETFQLDLSQAGHEARPLDAQATEVDVALSRDTLCALLGADLTLEEALLTDQLLLRGQPQDLLAVGEALACFLKGMLRVSSSDSLLQELLAQQVAEASE